MFCTASHPKSINFAAALEVTCSLQESQDEGIQCFYRKTAFTSVYYKLNMHHSGVAQPPTVEANSQEILLSQISY